MLNTPTVAPTIDEALSWPVIFNGERAPSYVKEIRSRDIVSERGHRLSEKVNEDTIGSAEVIVRNGKQVLYRLASGGEMLVVYK